MHDLFIIFYEERLVCYIQVPSDHESVEQKFNK